MSCNIIVQARMGSTRFPGKVMADCNGTPMIGALLKRLEEARHVAENLIVVIPAADADSELGGYLYNETDWEVVATGNDQDLASMFARAMADYPATAFCRICGDSPLADPVDVKITIRTHEKSKSLLTFGGYPGTGAVEVVNWKLFQKCLPRFTKEDREHVTTYFKRTCGLVVDAPEDFERIKHLIGTGWSASACLNALAARL